MSPLRRQPLSSARLRLGTACSVIGDAVGQVLVGTKEPDYLRFVLERHGDDVRAAFPDVVAERGPERARREAIKSATDAARGVPNVAPPRARARAEETVVALLPPT